MVDAYYQFRVDPSVSELYAFSTHMGNFEYCEILPQGEKNAPAWTNNAMAHIFASMPSVHTYFDDHCMSCDDPEELCDKLEEYLALCEYYNIKLSRKKAKVGFPSINALGFIISKLGYAPRDTQVEKFLAAPFPVRDQLRSWFGLLNVFRDFLPDMTKVESEFSAVRKKNAPWIITSGMRQAFEYAREQVSMIDILVFPDDSKPLYIDADASQFGCGAMLYQYNESNSIKLPLRFMAHVFTTAAIKWSTIEKECYALVRAFHTFENLLLGRTFIVRTDHRNLLWMQHSINAKVQRWFQYLCVFDFTLEHIPGVDNVVADALSRIFSQMSQRPLAELQPAFSSMAAMSMVADIHPAGQWSLERVEAYFKTLHDAYAAHGSIERTLQAFKDAGCIFPHLKQQVIRMVASCPTCIKSRAQRRNNPAVPLEAHTTNSFAPFAVFQADFLTGLPVSASGMSCILSLVCCFTRFTILFACPDQTAKSACNGLLYLWGLFSAPEVLVTDGAPCFVSEDFQELCNMLRVTHKVTLPNHPQAHGIVERQHQEIVATAKKAFLDISEATDATWPTYLPVVQRILNARTHTATGFAPHHLVFGSAVTERTHALDGDRADVALVTTTPVPTYIKNLDNALRLVVQAGLTSTEDRILKNYLKKPQVSAVFKVGDFVFITNTRPITQKLGKFAPNYVGPLLVITEYGNDIYQVQDIVQEKDNFYVHACDMVKSSISNVEDARAVAVRDYKEYFIHSVVSHSADPVNPDLLGKLTFDVIFTDDPSVTLTLPYNEVKYVEAVKDYLQRHKKELPAAWKQSHAAAGPMGLRARKQSQFLEGYETGTHNLV